MATAFWHRAEDFEIHVLTDMLKDVAMKMLETNDLLWLFSSNHFDGVRVHHADYSTHGENCKAILIKELEIDVHIDDHMGYLMAGPALGLFVVPRAELPYYCDEWLVDRCVHCKTTASKIGDKFWCYSCKKEVEAVSAKKGE
jgi:hypothetical protein